MEEKVAENSAGCRPKEEFVNKSTQKCKQS